MITDPEASHPTPHPLHWPVHLFGYFIGAPALVNLKRQIFSKESYFTTRCEYDEAPARPGQNVAAISTLLWHHKWGVSTTPSCMVWKVSQLWTPFCVLCSLFNLPGISAPKTSLQMKEKSDYPVISASLQPLGVCVGTFPATDTRVKLSFLS